MDSASSWSWVTYTVVRPRFWCSRRISVRISRRSFASRLLSGSSISTSDGSTTTAGDRDPLLLPAGELTGQFRRVFLQVDEPDRVIGAAPDLGSRHPAHLQTERDILVYGHVREERVVLKDHPESAAFRRQRVEPGPVPPDAAVAEREQPGEAVQRGGLPAAGRPEQRDELAAPDLQVEPGQRVRAGEPAGHPVQAQRLERGHFLTLAPPTSRSHLSNAATSAVASSGTSIGLFAISCRYSGRP